MSSASSSPRHITDAATHPATPSSREPSQDPSTVIRDSPATIELIHEEGTKEEATEEDGGFISGEDENQISETSLGNNTPRNHVLSTFPPVCSYCKTYTSADANDLDSYLSNMYRPDCPSSTDANDVNSFLRNMYRPKFAPAQYHPAPNQSTLCCSTLVYNFCFAQNISTRISRDFWFRLDTEYWAGCPSRACGSRSKFSVSDTLPVTLTPGIFGYVERYARAMACRDALQHLTPPPSKDPMDPREPLRTEIKVLPVDSVDGSQTFQVPVFVNWIIPDKASSRECLICCEAFQDVAYWPKTERNWAQVTRRFPGDWNYLVRPFMSPDALPLCSFVHHLDTCRNCLSDHIETQLQKGRSVIESLACPDPMCERIYTPEDVRKILNNPEVFSRYLKLRLLASLATLPNFSWCLRKGCEFGQEHVFPTPALPSSPTELDLPQNRDVFCHECGFSMCFTHQTPWHEGADCSQLGYGGDLVAASEAWIHQNTQRCPRCAVPVERTGGCFHVTCSLCRFEFCWLCLANWAGISVQDPYTHMATYWRYGHKPDCYFRMEDAPIALGIRGATLAEAVMAWVGVVPEVD